MKIVHISPCAPFNDGWGFQENLLPKQHVKMGHEVTLITTTKTHKNGELEQVSPGTFRSVDGFDVIRLPYVNYPQKHMTNIFMKLDVYDRLIELRPDFIFYHGLVSRTIFDVIKYKKILRKSKKSCVIVEDNHLDYNIGCDPKTLKEIILRSYYRLMNGRSQKYVQKVYGVTPWRKQYAEEYYHISSDKTDVLIMGADDEKIDFANRENIRTRIREMYHVKTEDFLIVTGGKIDPKKKIHVLMETCGVIKGVKLLVFGSVSDSIKEEYQKQVQKFDNIISVGWIDSDKVYDYFFAADLVFFPGQHSVLWEQACAAKVPCVFARWPGMDHVDNGGNATFIEDVTPESIRKMIEKLHFTKLYEEMKLSAESEITDIYLYSNIAKKSLQLGE